MKVWVLASLFTVAMAPAAFAVEDPAACLLDDTRRAVSEPRAEAPPAPATAARQTMVQRNVIEEGAAEPAPRQPVERRRNVKRIPDALLIGPRGAL